MAQEKMFREALDAIKQGQRSRARDLLTRLIRTDASNADYWLWMSTIVENPNERVFCLESALKADSNNPTARRGLVLLGVRPPDENVTPVPPLRRKWAADLEKELEAPKNLVQRIWANPIMRLVTILGAAVLLIGLVSLGVYGIRRQQEEMVFIRITPVVTRTPAPTLTPTPTATRCALAYPYLHTNPLWMFLDETYTPFRCTSTPHTRCWAYRASLRSTSAATSRTCWISSPRPSRPIPTRRTSIVTGRAHRLLGEYEERSTPMSRASP
jgi:hypothetical protein